MARWKIRVAVHQLGGLTRWSTYIALFAALHSASSASVIGERHRRASSANRSSAQDAEAFDFIIGAPPVCHRAGSNGPLFAH